MSGEPDMIPTKEVGQRGQYSGGLELDLTVDTDAALVQQRAVVARLGRDALEDRYLRLLEENTLLKKHACKQEDKIKKLATKLIRVVSDKKRMEVASGGPGKLRDIETEELIEDQQQRIRELEQHNTGLKEKLLVAKNQLVGVGRGGQGPRRSPARRLPPRTPSQQGPAPSPSPVPAHHAGNINQQAISLLEEARNENRMLEDAVTTLKEQVNIYEQEVDQIKEQARIKESNFEEEISILKTQVSQNQKQTVTENIEMIRLQRENKVRTAENQSLKAQLQGVEENLHKVKVEEETSKREADDLMRQLQEEQRKTTSLTQEISSSSSSRQSLFQAQEKVKDLQKDNTILREANEKLLSSAFDIERERSHQATEAALKLQISQLETTLKSDLNDKRRLTDALAKERETCAQLESDFQDLQSKFFAMKEDVENQENRINCFASENSVGVKELEEALLYLKQKAVEPPSLTKSAPSFLDQLDTEDRSLKTELSELQVQYIEAINEIEKTRNLLRVQININTEQKKEISILQKRLGTTKQEFQDQVAECHKLLEMRSTKIQKLESQLRETALGNLQKSWNQSHLETGLVEAAGTTVHTASGQSLFELHILRVTLGQEALLSLGLPQPRIFVSWLFYDSAQSYTPVMPGPVANFASSSYYKVKLDDSFLEYLQDTEVLLQVHLAINNDCQTVAGGSVKFSEILDYPSNKLHGTVQLVGPQGGPDSLGSLDYWLKLHTHDLGKIRSYQERRHEADCPVGPVTQPSSFLQVERRPLTRNSSTITEASSLESSDPQPRPAPRAKPPRLAADIKVDTEEKRKSMLKPKKVRAVEKSRELKEPNNREYEPKTLSKKKNTSLSKKAANKLDKMLQERAETSGEKTSNEENVPVKELDELQTRIQRTETNVTTPKVDVDIITSNQKKKRSILKSLSGKRVNSEESSLLTDETKASEDNQDPEIPEKRPERERTFIKDPEPQKLSVDTEESKVNEKEIVESDESLSDEESEEESESEEDSEGSETEDDSEQSEDNDDATTTEATTRADTSVATTTSEAKPAAIKVMPDIHRVSDGATDSHDSEGVIIKKSPTKKNSATPNKDNIIIVVSEFEAAKSAAFIQDDKVSQLYVEYTFLDISSEELETPFSLPKPSQLESITFNFRKVFNVDKAENSARRRLVSKLLRAETAEARLLTFTLVSEPPDSEPDLDCEDIGTACVDLGIISRSGDLVDHPLDVLSTDSSNSCIGTLMVSIHAAQAFKSIKS